MGNKYKDGPWIWREIKTMSKLEEAANEYAFTLGVQNRETRPHVAFLRGALWLLEQAKRNQVLGVIESDNAHPVVLLEILEELCK